MKPVELVQVLFMFRTTEHVHPIHILSPLVNCEYESLFFYIIIIKKNPYLKY